MNTTKYRITFISLSSLGHWVILSSCSFKYIFLSYFLEYTMCNNLAKLLWFYLGLATSLAAAQKNPFLQGPVSQDTTCTIDVVEKANQRQLSLILSSLTSTMFFRLFRIDLSSPCEYDFDQGKFIKGSTALKVT